MTRFVIVVDMQHDFVVEGAALPVPGAEAIVAPMQAFLAGLKPEETAGVLMTFDTHVPEVFAGSPEAAEFPIHCVKGEKGWESVLEAQAIDPSIPVYRLEKGVFDMWAEPGVIIEGPEGKSPREAFFDALKAKGVSEVVVVGVAADYCVRWAMDGLVARGFRVVLPEGLTRGIARQAPQVVAEDFEAGAVALAA